MSATWTVASILDWSKDYLHEKGSLSPKLDAELLLAESLVCDRMALYLQRERPLTADERAQYREMIQRRSAGEPVAYILGHKPFWRHEFAVSPAVLIPRPETETLVEAVLDEHDENPRRVLDVGTGSGCIALSLALARPSWSVAGWDVSADAVALASQNATNLEAGNAAFSVHNIFDAIDDIDEGFDLVVSNPPYVKHGDPALDKNVEQFEPAAALFGGEDGLDFYRFYATNLARLVRPGGTLYCEVGHDQAAAVERVLQDAGWAHTHTFCDLSGVKRVVRVDCDA